VENKFMLILLDGPPQGESSAASVNHAGSAREAGCDASEN